MCVFASSLTIGKYTYHSICLALLMKQNAVCHGQYQIQNLGWLRVLRDDVGDQDKMLVPKLCHALLA